MENNGRDTNGRYMPGHKSDGSKYRKRYPRRNKLITCVECKRNFLAARSTRRYCSPECAQHARNRARPAQKQGFTQNEIAFMDKLALLMPRATALIRAILREQDVTHAKTAIRAIYEVIEVSRSRFKSKGPN